MYKWYFSFFKNNYVKRKMILVFMFVTFMAIINSFTPYILKILIDKELISPNYYELTLYTSILSVMYFLRFIFFKLISYNGHKYGLYIEKEIRDSTFSKLMDLDLKYFKENKNGNIGSIFTNEATNLGEFSFHIFQMSLQSILSLIMGIIIMLNINIRLTLVLLVVIIITQIYNIKLSGKQKKIFKRINENIANLNGNVNETLNNILLVKTNSQEELVNNEFLQKNNEFARTYLEAYIVLSKFIGWSRFCVNLYNFIIIGYGSYMYINHDIKISTLISFLIFITLLTKPINSFISTFDMFISATANISKLYSISLLKPEIIKNEVNDFTNGDITFNNIAYKYDKKDVLKKINISIKKNTTIGIVGESGSGKTTIINLLLRNINPSEGTISIDQTNINDIKWSSYKKNIAIVTQNTHIFNDTIKNNIIFGSNYSDERYFDSIKFAYLEDVIKTFDNSDKHIIDEDGSNLSGGQKQRISIARAILKDADILIFDEATSALDNKTERIIQENIDMMGTNKTMIIIAHRLSTIKKADKILVLKEGEIVEEGSFNELIKNKSHFYKIKEGSE